MLARDIMTTSVVSVGPDTAIPDIARTLLQNRVSGVPVVGKDGKLLGIVSEGDLMRRPETGTEPPHTWWLSQFGNAERIAAEFSKTHGHDASDVMTRNVISVGEDTPAREIAELLEKRRIKRVPVLRNGLVVGIVSRANLVQALATSPKAGPDAPSPDDRAIRERLRETIDHEFGMRAWLVDFTVSDGVVNLWGAAESAAEKEAVRIAAENVPGVSAVTDRMGVLPPMVRSLIWAE